MKVCITGANGFIAKNLIAALRRDEKVELLLLSKSNNEKFKKFILEADIIFHLAGVNRPQNPQEFYEGNSALTQNIVQLLLDQGKDTPIVLSSSTQVKNENDYGKSKQNAENSVKQYAQKSGAKVAIYQLPNVFGKLSKPNYNTVIATWCYNITHDLAIQVNDDSTQLQLVYIDDVIKNFLKHVEGIYNSNPLHHVDIVYSKTLGEIKRLLEQFKQSRTDLIVPNVGSGFERALYATYLSFLDTKDFSYELNGHNDDRGTFYEIVKTLDAGQFSISTTASGITRGNHYHDTKNEKFLVIKGQARIEYRHIFSEDVITYDVSDKKMEVVEMIPGYTHNITNTGSEEMVLLIWANERFDQEHTDTHFLKV